MRFYSPRKYKLNKVIFEERKTVEFVEEGNSLAPKFNQDGVLPVVVTEDSSGLVLMIGYMNKESLKKTIETREGYYWSRSRKVLWHKGNSSGMVHKVKEILIDDDQDSIWLKVEIEGIGASCHVGYKSCFYRSLEENDLGDIALKFTESEKIFDPEVVYPGSENPTQL
jgi:phosphoribosyl-AMP cyclohydrolase